MQNYLYKKCDLCGSDKHTSLVKGMNDLSMTSDSRIIKRKLQKVICDKCKLVREGADFPITELEEHYKDSYVLNTHEANSEHIFFRNDKQVPRSEAIKDWFVEILESVDVANVKTALEIGAGQGSLLEKLACQYPAVSFTGYEVNSNAVKQAQAKGLNIQQGSYTDIEGTYDLIYAFGVFEHVASPTDFLRRIYLHLNDGGYLILGQPMQNVESYDVFFSDHLHHFNVEHVDMFGQKTGFVPVKTLMSPWFAINFSLHLFRKGKGQNRELYEAVSNDLVAKTVEKWNNLFAKVNALDNAKK